MKAKKKELVHLSGSENIWGATPCGKGPLQVRRTMNWNKVTCGKCLAARPNYTMRILRQSTDGSLTEKDIIEVKKWLNKPPFQAKRFTLSLICDMAITLLKRRQIRFKMVQTGRYRSEADQLRALGLSDNAC